MPASDLFRPMIVGRKYIKPRNSRKSMARLFPQSQDDSRKRTYGLLQKYTRKGPNLFRNSVAGEFDPVAARAFGGIERGIGAAQQLRKFGAAFRFKTGDSKA